MVSLRRRAQVNVEQPVEDSVAAFLEFASFVSGLGDMAFPRCPQCFFARFSKFKVPEGS